MRSDLRVNPADVDTGLHASHSHEKNKRQVTFVDSVASPVQTTDKVRSQFTLLFDFLSKCFYCVRAVVGRYPLPTFRLSPKSFAE